MVLDIPSLTVELVVLVEVEPVYTMGLDTHLEALAYLVRVMLGVLAIELAGFKSLAEAEALVLLDLIPQHLVAVLQEGVVQELHLL